MSHTILVPDETYEALARLAAERRQTIEELLRALVAETEVPQPASTGDYNPADDPLAGYLGALEAISPDDVERHDQFFGASDADSTK